jgi:hypothetical protein
MIPYKLNPEICLFRSLSEAEKRVPRGFVWVMGKEGLFGGAGFFGSDHLSMGSHQESKEDLNSRNRETPPSFSLFCHRPIPILSRSSYCI